MLTNLLAALVIIPIIGWLVCVLVPKRNETAVFVAVISTVLLQQVVFFALLGLWVSGGTHDVSASLGHLFSNASYTFGLEFYFDKLSAVFLGITTVMSALIFAFARYYMHREPGYKRFFYTTMLFFIGLTLIILAGNFEVLLLGWEFIGISSVLLVAFYRDRYLPTRNSMKVFSVYRIADAFLLVAIWYAHHIFEHSVNFSEFSHLVVEHGNQLMLLGFFLLVVALIKSAQFPFSYWVPRAMEGPTTSSAIFYGALSVHMGLFLLLRTFPLWEGSVGMRVAVGLVGLTTAIVATSIARVQSSIKTQIAYSSIAQIGIMFVELALGLWWLAVAHFVSNAALRAYQLLISPSVVSYLVHDQFFYFVPPVHKIKNTLLGKIRATVYVLGIKEWNLNSGMSRFVWQPLKTAGRMLNFLEKPQAWAILLALFVGGTVIAATTTPSSAEILAASVVSAVVAIMFYVRANATKGSARTAWNLIMIGHMFGALYLGLASSASWKYFAMYWAGVAAAFVTGHAVLWYVQVRGGEKLTLDDYHGSVYSFYRLGHIFFLICLLFMAFPISPSFLAQDILLSFIPASHIPQIVLFCVIYMLVGVSIMRLYTKVFFGRHKDSHHEIAYKSS